MNFHFYWYVFQLAKEKNFDIIFLIGAVYLLRTSLKLELTTVFRTTTGVIVLSFHLRSFCIVGGRTAPITDMIPNNLKKVLIAKHVNFNKHTVHIDLYLLMLMPFEQLFCELIYLEFSKYIM